MSNECFITNGMYEYDNESNSERNKTPNTGHYQI